MLIARAFTRVGLAVRTTRGRTLALMAAIAATLAVVSPPTAVAGWTSIGTPGTGDPTNPSTELEWHGSELWAAWNDPDYNVQLAHWDGATWTLITSPGGGGTRPTNPSLASDGTSLYTAYNDGYFAIQFKRWDGTAWTAIGTPIDQTINTEPNLIYAGGWFYLAYQDDSQVVQILRGDGSGTWSAFATSPGSGGGSNTYPELAHDGTSLHVTFNTGSGTQLVKRWNGSTWDDLGSWAEGRNTVPALNVAGGLLHTARSTATNNAPVLVRVGGEWISHGDMRPAGTTNFAYPAMAWSGTTLYGSVTDDLGNAQVLRWEGPLPPDQLRQFAADGTTEIPQGQWTTDGITTNVRLRFRGTHQTAGATLTPWIELRPAGTAFSATCGTAVAGVTWSGPAATVTTAHELVSLEVPVTGLADGTEYHWRACVVDGGATASDWVELTPGFGVSSTPRWTLVPDTARAANGVWGHNVAPGCARSTTSSTEPLAIDEIRSVASEAACTATASEELVSTISDPTAGSDEYELTNAPSDLQTLTDMTVHARLRKTNSRTMTVTAQVRLADGTAVGTATSHAVDTTWVNYSYSLTGLSLTKTQVDGMFLELAQSVSGGGPATAAEASLVNVDVSYTASSGSSITVAGTALAGESGTPWSQCDGATANVAISVDGAAPLSTSCDATTGAFSRSVAVTAADSVVAVFMDPSSPGDRSVTYTRNLDTSTSITGLTVVLGRTSIRSESGTPVTNGSIDLYDSTQDADIPASSDGTTLTVAGTQLVVRSGATFAPGGDVSVPRLRIIGTYQRGSAMTTITAGDTGGCDTVSPPAFCNEGSFPAGTGLVRVTSPSSTVIRGDTAFATLEVVPASGSPVIQLWNIQSYETLVMGDGAASVTVDTSANPTLTISGTTTIRANATMAHTGSGTITAQGPLVVDGSLSGAGTGTLTANGDLRGAGTVDLSGNVVELRPAGTTVTLGSTGAGDWHLQGLLLSNSSTSTAAIVQLAGGGTGMLHVRATLTLGGALDTISVTLDADTYDRTLDVDGDVIVAATGGLSASSSAAFRIGGSFSRTGTFLANAGTVTFDDASRVSTLSYSGATSFANLIVATSSKELRFDEVDRTTVTATLQVDGAACTTPVLLRSAIAGDAFELDAQGTTTVSYARIADSSAVTASSASSSFDGGGNSGWTIDDGSCAGAVTIATSVSSIDLGLVVPGTDVVGSVTASVTTDDMDGYTLYATDTSDTWSVECAACPANVPDWTGDGATPTSWSEGSAGYAGVTVRDATGGRLAKWGTGTGTTETDFTNNLFAGLDAGTSTTLHSRSSATSADSVLISYRINAQSSQQAGSYAGSIALTVTATP